MKVDVANFWIGISFPNHPLTGTDEEKEAQQVRILECLQEAKGWFHEFCLSHHLFPEVMRPGPEPFAPERAVDPIAIVFNGFRSLEVPFPLEALKGKELELERTGADWRIACSEMEVEAGGVWELQGDWTYDSVIEDMKRGQG